MIIESVEVKNFRSIREASLVCNDLTAIIGRNGAGKSCFLYAIDAFYDVAASITKEDFFNRDVGSPIEIRLTYGNLSNEEKKEFQTYIKDGILIVTKRFTYENEKIIQRYYAAALQIPQFAQIRALPKKSEKIKAWNELITSGEIIGLGGKVKRADEIEQLMNEYEAQHPEKKEPIEREEQFFGPRNIGGGKLDNFTKFVLIPAVREASDEVSSKKGAIYQILDMIVLRKINAREDIRKFKSELEGRVKELYSSSNLTELPELGEEISQTLEKFAPGSRLNLNWEEVKPPDILPPTAKATLIEDSFEGEITRKGHGLQRALIVTLLQHLSMIFTAKPLEDTPTETTVAVQGPDLILAFEEPELYLHPSRCRYLANLLLQLAESPGTGLGNRNQIIYTSHSPYFVDLQRFDKIRVLRKIPSPDSPVPQSSITCFSLEQAADILATVCEANPCDFTRETFKARAMSVMNTIVNEGFFADLVVIVEGPSEVCTLWKLQEIMMKDWSQLGIVVVPAGGKNNLDRPVVIFRGLSIPTYFIFDGDAQLICKKGKERDAKKRNRRYLRLAGAKVEDFPNTQVHETWAVFRENLEGIFKESLGDETFSNIREEVASELGYDDCDRACKNTEGASRFVELIYSKGYNIQILEEVVEKITDLRNI